MHVEALKYNAITETPPRKGNIYGRSPEFWKPSARLCLNSLNVQCTASLPYPIPTGAATATHSWAVHLPPRSPPGKKIHPGHLLYPSKLQKKSTTSPLAKKCGKRDRTQKWVFGWTNGKEVSMIGVLQLGAMGKACQNDGDPLWTRFADDIYVFYGD